MVDKPADWTSSDVVAKLRGIFHEKRIGHAGTLDPMATGLLTVFVGRATRAVEFAEKHSKEYVAGLRLGIVTDTQDITGTVIQEKNASAVTAEMLSDALLHFTGEIDQIPPMYSAIKVKGKKLYELARKGQVVERSPRRITIGSIIPVGKSENDIILDVCCSKGTYIRTLCHDIGEYLGTGACMSSLRRIKAGEYDVSAAYTIEQIQAFADQGKLGEIVLPVDSMFSDHPSVTVTEKIEKKIRCGNAVPVDLDSGCYRIYSESGEFLALGQAENGTLATIKSFFEV